MFQESIRLFLWNLKFQRQIAKTHTIGNPRLKHWQHLYRKITENRILKYLLIPLLPTSDNVRFNEYTIVTERLKSQNPILEIGCGKSCISTYLKHKGLEVIGLDLQRSRLKDAKQTSKQLKANCEYLVSDACHLPFRTESICQVLAISVLEHIPHEQAVVQEAHRVLKFQGIFYLTLPYSATNNTRQRLPDGSFQRTYTQTTLKQRILNIADFHATFKKFIAILPIKKLIHILNKTPFTDILIPPFGLHIYKEPRNSRYFYGVALELHK